MLEKNKRERIIALVNKEVVPAIGCTEPMAVALCTAQAATTLGKRPERIQVLLSPNMLKNAMGVGYTGNGIKNITIRTPRENDKNKKRKNRKGKTKPQEIKNI